MDLLDQYQKKVEEKTPFKLPFSMDFINYYQKELLASEYLGSWGNDWAGVYILPIESERTSWGSYRLTIMFYVVTSEDRRFMDAIEGTVNNIASHLRGVELNNGSIEFLKDALVMEISHQLSRMGMTVVRDSNALQGFRVASFGMHIEVGV